MDTESIGKNIDWQANEAPEKYGNTKTQDNLNRTLKARHMTMIAIGGTIGTGLFVASGGSLNAAGPAGSLMAYLVTGIVVFFVMSSLAEMSTYIPIAGSFNAFAGRFVDPAFGFAIGYNYWYCWIVTVATDLVAGGIIMQYWLPKVNPMIWNVILLLIVIGLNLFGAKLYGETEFWLSTIKVLTIIIFIIVGILVASGAVGGTKYGFSNWSVGEAPFVDGFGGFIQVFIYAGYSFQGTEIIGVTSGESKNPSRDVPRAIRSIFWRILLFYVLSVFLVGLIIPYDNENLIKADIDAIAISPFVLVLQKAGIKAAPDIMNAVILTSVLSAGNSGLYLTTRGLYALCVQGMGPKLFTRVSKQGTPIYCLLFGSIVSLVLVLVSLIGNQAIYIWFVSLTSVAGFISWIGILFTHWRFRRAYNLQGYHVENLPYVSALYPFGMYFSFILLIFILLAQGNQTFINNPFDLSGFLKVYLGIPLFIVMYVVCKLVKKTKLIPLMEIDLETDSFLSLGFANVRTENNTIKEKLISLIS